MRSDPSPEAPDKLNKNAVKINRPKHTVDLSISTVGISQH